VLVSIVIPTLTERDRLVERAIRSVVSQDFADPIEIVLVADVGSEAFIRWGTRTNLVAVEPWRSLRAVEINGTWRDGVREKSVGAVPWMVGSLLAHGSIIGFLGDDDEFHPEHVRRHVEVLMAGEADFTLSPVRFCVGGVERFVIGDGSFQHGHLDSDGIMCHARCLNVATWTANGEDAADFRLVRDWRAGGLVGQFIGGPPTATHHDGWAAR
jgi:cellulose synthase/poly-beta-1,6-N-acetylglucosamine synthase-like glycosyltransferase